MNNFSKGLIHSKQFINSFLVVKVPTRCRIIIRPKKMTRTFLMVSRFPQKPPLSFTFKNADSSPIFNSSHIKSVKILNFLLCLFALIHLCSNGGSWILPLRCSLRSALSCFFFFFFYHFSMKFLHSSIWSIVESIL